MDEINPTADHSATTRVAYVNLPRTEVEFSRRDQIRTLINRGYNTMALPLMKDGRLMAFPGQGRKQLDRSELEGVLIKAIQQTHETSDASIWITVDPLSAFDSESGELSNFAQDHRAWLLRNTRGRAVPIGKHGKEPLFSWINSSYRRYLGDLMVSLAQTQNFQAFVLDLRKYPVKSSNPDKWFCCSYESQTRATEELKVNFEQMLSEGNRSEIHRWQRWIFQELTTLVRYLKSRVRVARFDIYWKVLVDYTNPHDREESPWVSWVRDGLVEEVLIDFNPEETSPAAVIQQIDVASGRHGLIVPTYQDEGELKNGWDQLKTCCTTGYVVLAPDYKEKYSLPFFDSVWEFEGALEDNPHESAIALAEYLCRCFSDQSSLGRFYYRLAKSLQRFEPEPTQVGKLLHHVERMEKRFEDKAYYLNPKYKDYFREMELLLRILPTIRMIPEVY